MTRREFLKTYAVRFAVALAMLGLIVYTFAHAMGFAVGSILTTPTRLITDTQITSAEAYLFRDEEVLTATQTGLVDTLSQSGVKVSKNTPVAEVYAVSLTGDALAQAQLTLDRINRALYVLEQGEVKPSTTLAQAEVYRAEATELYREIGMAVEAGNLEQIPALEEKFLIALQRYTSLVGDTEADALAQPLQREKNALLEGITPETIKSERSSGIFYDRGYVDGYESAFTVSAAQSLTPSSLQALLKQEPQASSTQTVGKLVYGYEWYVAMELSTEVAKDFQTGKDYRITFSDNGERTLCMTLVRLQAEGERVAAVFRSEEHPTGFVFYRVQEVKITVGESTGLYVPDAALQQKNGATGVYIFEESTVRFRRIDVIYRGDGYCIAALPGDGSATELNENDILITSGRDLYEGKVYQ